MIGFSTPRAEELSVNFYTAFYRCPSEARRCFCASYSNVILSESEGHVT